MMMNWGGILGDWRIVGLWDCGLRIADWRLEVVDGRGVGEWTGLDLDLGGGKIREERGEREGRGVNGTGWIKGGRVTGVTG